MVGSGKLPACVACIAAERTVRECADEAGREYEGGMDARLRVLAAFDLKESE